MMKKITQYAIAPCLLAGGLFACENTPTDSENSPVRDETKDLRQALRNAETTKPTELQDSVEKTRQELAKMRTRLARAEDGVTDEVIEEAKELKEAMKSQMAEVVRKIEAAKVAAQQYNELNDEATQLLAQAVPSEYKADVQVQLREMPGKVDVSTTEVERTIEVEMNELPEDIDSEQTMNEGDEEYEGSQRKGARSTGSSGNETARR